MLMVDHQEPQPPQNTSLTNAKSETHSSQSHLVFMGVFIPGSLGWGPGWGRSHSVQWSWVLRIAGQSTGTQCASLCSPSPLEAAHVYLQQTFDILFVKTDIVHTAYVCDQRTKQGQKKWWNRHWLCSPLVLICNMTFNLCVLAPLIRCHELLTLSASFTESTVSTRNRFGTPGKTETWLSAHFFLLNAAGAEGWQSLTQKFVDIILLEMADKVPLDFWTWA